MTDHVHYQQMADLPGLVLGTARLEDFHFERHFHLDCHIGLVTHGVQRQCLKGQTFLLGPGRITLMPPGEIHDGASGDDGAYTLKTFRLSADLLRGLAEQISDRPVQGEPALAATLLDAPPLAGRLLQLHGAMEQAQSAQPLALQSEWLGLLAQLLEQVQAVQPLPAPGALSPLQWQRVKDYCFAHFGDKISLDALAALCGLGPFQFLRQFKRSVGMTPHAWLVRLRLEQACALLQRRQHSIAEVAHGVGFYDQSHFNRAFRQAFGVAPSHYQ